MVVGDEVVGTTGDGSCEVKARAPESQSSAIRVFNLNMDRYVPGMLAERNSQFCGVMLGPSQIRGESSNGYLYILWVSIIRLHGALEVANDLS